MSKNNVNQVFVKSALQTAKCQVQRCEQQTEVGNCLNDNRLYNDKYKEYTEVESQLSSKTDPRYHHLLSNIQETWAGHTSQLDFTRYIRAKDFFPHPSRHSPEFHVDELFHCQVDPYPLARPNFVRWD